MAVAEKRIVGAEGRILEQARKQGKDKSIDAVLSSARSTWRSREEAHCRERDDRDHAVTEKYGMSTPPAWVDAGEEYNQCLLNGTNKLAERVEAIAANAEKPGGRLDPNQIQEAVEASPWRAQAQR
jgi:hypothetical protein